MKLDFAFESFDLIFLMKIKMLLAELFSVSGCDIKDYKIFIFGRMKNFRKSFYFESECPGFSGHDA